MPDRVLIVGAGPTGLTAALELSRLGIPVRIIDKQAAPPTTSRAVGVQARTLELLELRGLADEMVRLGNPGLAASFYGGGKRVFRLDFTRIDSRYHYLLFISQAETERILRTAVEKQGVRIERGVELVGLAQDVLSHDPNPVRVVLRHADGRLEQAQAPWLISAEGAHSIVRATLDLPFEGKTRDEQYALGDLHIDGELAETDLHIFSSAHGFLGLFPMGNRRFRLMASNPLSRPSKDTAPTLEELQAIYDQRSRIPARFRDMSWSSWFRINSRMVARLKVGRLLLGGDSAHIHSPAGAQGMNTGIQDMINLAWKLALVLKGQAPPALLDTYEQERLPVIRDVLAKTEGMTNVIGSGNSRPLGSRSRDGPGHDRYSDVPACDRLSGQSALRHLLAGGATCRRPRAGPAGAVSQRRWRWLAGKDTVQLARSVPVHAPGRAFRRVGSGPCRSVRCRAAVAPPHWRCRAGACAGSGPRAIPGSFRPVGRRLPGAPGWLCRFRQRRARMDSAA